MITDYAGLKPKGWVQIELYDPQTGDVLQHIENHNIVTNSASEVMAQVLSNPGAYKEIRKTVVLDTEKAPDNTGFYLVQLPHHRSSARTASLTGDGTKTLSLGATGRLIRLDRVRVKGVDQTIGRDVWISNEDAGQITFAEPVGEGDTVEVDYTYQTDYRFYMMPGSETITVGPVTYERSTRVDNHGRLIPESGKYVIDEETGRVWFDQVLEGVSVTYSYKMVRGLVFMGISDRPEGHPIGQPMVFTEADKGKATLDAEYEGARQPLILPATVTTGSSFTDTIIGNGYDVAFTLSHRSLIEIKEVYNISKGEEIPLSAVWIVDAVNGNIQFETAPEASDVIRITYTWNSGSTVTFIADFPPNVPGPQQVKGHVYTTKTGDYTGDSAVDRVYQLPHRPDEVISVVVGETTLIPGNDYTVSGNQIILNSTPQAGVDLKVTYNYTKQSADIYEVGLFTEDEGGFMFAISGIGPVTKDVNTGMRVTWSITF